MNRAVFCLDLSNAIPYKNKKNLIELITSNGGKVSFILNRKVNYLLRDTRENADTYKTRTAHKLGILVLHIDFVHEWISEHTTKQIDIKKYIIENRDNIDCLKKGRIAKVECKNHIKKLIDLSKLKFYGQHNIGSDFFDEENFQIIKWIVFKKINEDQSTIIELHLSKSLNKKYEYRARIEKRSSSTVSVEYVFANDGTTLYQIYKHLTSKYTDEKQYAHCRYLPSASCGSKLLQTIAWKSTIEQTSSVCASILEFIEFIWQESIGNLEDLFGVDLNEENINKLNLNIETLNKAECVLRKQKEEIKFGGTADYSDEFYGFIPFDKKFKTSLTDKRCLSQRFEICQVLRDIISVNEATNWNLRTSTISKYRSIGSHIRQLDATSSDYINIKNKILGSVDKDYFLGENSDSQPNILNIYEVVRPGESMRFKDYLGNVKQLFHGSKSNNLIGILSRGLLLPSYVVSEYGGTRTDVGMLGCGIYFSDCINTSLKYANLSHTKNTRFVALCDVALGKCKEYLSIDTSLETAPEGYHSTHGVKTNGQLKSDFIDDEYVIYDINQQEIRYLIELKYDFDEVKGNSKLKVVNEEQGNFVESDDVVTVGKNEIEQLEKGLDVLNKSECGLVSKRGASIPLKSVHIRGQLLDMICKIVIFQEYKNEGSVPIEARYVFPLDDGSTVCGFEAFINDKHVIGVCKEKEEAHKEYKEAIKRGDGAYLMDQESPEVFKVNVGNLPPNCSCIIKITYVAELNVENESIIFRLPNHVAPWQSGTIKNTNDQKTLLSKYLDIVNSKKASLQLSIVMPFEIRSIRSPTHLINLKQTACHAVVELDKRKILNEQFILCINMSTVHMPRMIVEDTPEPSEHTRACMVSFYPEFESEKIEDPCMIFALDCSNSMSHSSIESAKKLLLLMLNHMPKSCRFNVISFGSDYTELFVYPTKVSETTINKAIRFVNDARSNCGNTNFIGLLQPYFLLDHNEFVNFVLISDGHLNEEKSILSLLDVNKSKQLSLPRIFTCAVGDFSNKHLLKIISNNTCASHEMYDTKHKSKWKCKVIDLMDKICQPSAIERVEIEWETHNNEKYNEYIQQAPSKIASIFNGSRLVVYGFVPNCQKATLKAIINGQEISAVVTCPELLITKGTIIHKLCAKALINDWQYGFLSNDQFENDLLREKLKNDVIKMSKLYSITSEYTSFIAIESRSEEEKAQKWRHTTTPAIDSLISNDVDTCNIDILPYMQFDQQQLNENFDENSYIKDTLTEYFEIYENIDNDEKDELYDYLKNINEQIQTFGTTHPLRIKYGLLLMKEYIRKNRFELAMNTGKKYFDDAISELDTLCEDSYKDTTLFMQQLRDEMTQLSTLSSNEPYDESLDQVNQIEILDIYESNDESEVNRYSESADTSMDDDEAYQAISVNKELTFTEELVMKECESDFLFDQDKTEATFSHYLKAKKLDFVSRSAFMAMDECFYNYDANCFEEINELYLEDVEEDASYYTREYNILESNSKIVKPKETHESRSNRIKCSQNNVYEDVCISNFLASSASDVLELNENNEQIIDIDRIVYCKRSCLIDRNIEKICFNQEKLELLIEKRTTEDLKNNDSGNIFLAKLQSTLARCREIFHNNQDTSFLRKLMSQLSNIVEANGFDSFQKEYELNFKELFDELFKCGLKSLGLAAVFEIKKVVVCIVACYIFYIYFEFFVESKKIVKNVKDIKEQFNGYFQRNDSVNIELSTKFNQFVDYIEHISLKYPLICSILEIANNWNHLIEICFS